MAERAPLEPSTVIGTTVKNQVVFCGPLGVGKTTAVRAVSTIPPADTEMAMTGEQEGRTAGKATTTVGIDYGEWHSDELGPVAVLGAPGQLRFDVIRRCALNPAHAVVLWLYGQNDFALDEAREWLEYLHRRNSLLCRLTVAVTRLDHPEAVHGLEDYRPVLDEFDETIGLVAGDPRDAEEVAKVICAALRRVQES